MLLFSAVVAGSFPLGAAAANDISPLALNAVRFFVAAVVIGGVLVSRGQMRRAVFVAPWRFLLLGGVLSVYFVSMFEGLKTAAPVSAAAVFTLTPIITAGIGWVLLRQVTTPRIALALALGAVGALWVIFDADFEAFVRFEIGRGEAIYFVGCVAHAFYTPLVRWVNRGESALVSSFGTLVAGGCVIGLIGAGEIAATDWTALPGRVWVAIFYTAIFASAGTFTLLQFSVLRLPSSKVMAYTYLVPAWVTIWGIALGGTAPPAIILVGVSLTILSLLLLLKNDTAPTST